MIENLPEFVEINTDDLTIEESELVEEKAGMAITSLAKEDAPKFKLIRAIAAVILRRQYPNATDEELWAAAGKSKPQFKRPDEDPNASGDSTTSD